MEINHVFNFNFHFTDIYTIILLNYKIFSFEVLRAIIYYDVFFSFEIKFISHYRFSFLYVPNR